MTAAFMAQQAQCQAESARLCTELRASVKETVSQYKLTTQTRAAEATDVLKFKANALEKVSIYVLVKFLLF